MEFSSIIGILVVIVAFLLVIGLIRPGFTVFWSKNKSRASVLAVWGGALLVLIIAYWVVNAGRNDPAKTGSRYQTEQVRRG
jgi:NADH:ubiquinone oxidoreductase subunit 6 (subunit J)